jgi:hypothetical protein
LKTWRTLWVKIDEKDENLCVFMCIYVISSLVLIYISSKLDFLEKKVLRIVDEYSTQALNRFINLRIESLDKEKILLNQFFLRIKIKFYYLSGKACLKRI